MVKIVAFYLPQYHEFEENNEWWGKGYTEWDNVRSARPLFKGHEQPKVPLGGYYDLANAAEMGRQYQLAQQHGVDAFCVYHYWSKGQMLMQKPIGLLRNDPSIPFKYFFSWGNHSFHNKVQFKDRVLLREQEYGGLEDVRNHYLYLRDHFGDDRYVKEDGKPVFMVYDAKRAQNLDLYFEHFDKWAREDGFDGIHLMSTIKDHHDAKFSDPLPFAALVEYQPVLSNYPNAWRGKIYDVRRVIAKDLFKKHLKLNAKSVIKNVIASTPKTTTPIHLGAYVAWDTTPRWKERAIIHLGSTPKRLEDLLDTQIKRSAANENYGDMIFITAWNEWGEGAILEPDEIEKLGYLEAVQSALRKNATTCLGSSFKCNT